MIPLCDICEAASAEMEIPAEEGGEVARVCIWCLRTVFESVFADDVDEVVIH